MSCELMENSSYLTNMGFNLHIFTLYTLFVHLGLCVPVRMATLLSRFRIDFSDINVLGDINTKPKKHK